VPAKCWKVVAVVDGGEGGPADAAKIGPRTRLIGVVMPNDQSVGHGWAKFRVSVRDVETLTGYQFFEPRAGRDHRPAQGSRGHGACPGQSVPADGD